jgi:hypothetical protein
MDLFCVCTIPGFIPKLNVTNIKTIIPNFPFYCSCFNWYNFACHKGSHSYKECVKTFSFGMKPGIVGTQYHVNH